MDRDLEVKGEPRLVPEGVELICPECGDRIAVTDVRAFIQGLHQRVCPELGGLNGEGAS